MDQSPVRVVLLHDGASISNDLIAMAEKLAELDKLDVIVVGGGSVVDRSKLFVGFDPIDVSALEVAVCYKPSAYDFYDDWRHEEANLPLPITLLGDPRGPQRYPGTAPKHTGKDRVSFGTPQRKQWILGH